MKHCPSCKLDKEREDFRKDVSRLDGLNVRCKLCVRASTQRGYREKYQPMVSARNKATYRTNREIIDLYKIKHGCKLCSEREPICLEFHHLDPTQKDFGIAHYLLSPIEKVWNEISKCELLCSNCHKKVHAGVLTL